ncbi:hypothetical protein BGX21_000017 [Mortierella sp. AD011]|nr:hypothetical protein BGX21_000017 [Mortierella sp. AD011]
MSWDSFEVENEWTSDRLIYSSGPGYEPAIASTSTGISCRSREKKRKLEHEWDIDPYEYGWDSSSETGGFSFPSAFEIASTSVKAQPTPGLYASSLLGDSVGKPDDLRSWSATDAHKLPKLVRPYSGNDGRSSTLEDVPVQSLVCALGQSQLGSDELDGIDNEEMVMRYTTLVDGASEIPKEADKKQRKKCAPRNKAADKMPIKSGRWTAAEDKALVQGVFDYLSSRGLEPQPPSHLPMEQELDTSKRTAQDASAILTITNLHSVRPPVGHLIERQSKRHCWGDANHEHSCLGAVGSDVELFDSIVDVSYVANGEDTFEGIAAASNYLELNPHSGSVLPHHRRRVHHWTMPPALFSPLVPPQLKEISLVPILTGHTSANRQIDVFWQPHFQFKPVSHFHGGSCETTNVGSQQLGGRSQKLSPLPSPSRNPGLGISDGSPLFDGTITQISYHLGYQQPQQELFPFNRYDKNSYPQQHHYQHQEHWGHQGFFGHNHGHPSAALSLPITPPFSASPSASPQTSVPEPTMSSDTSSPQVPFTTCDPHTFDCGSNTASKDIHLVKLITARDVPSGDTDHGVQVVSRQTTKSVASGPIKPCSTSLAFTPLHASQQETPKTQESYITAISRAMSQCPWSVIASHVVPGRTGVQAQARWSEALDPKVKKGPWTAEEDALLLKGVQQSEKCWIWIADGIPGRTQRQCRTRWVQISSRQERNAAAMARATGKTGSQVQVGGLPAVEMDTASSSSTGLV